VSKTAKNSIFFYQGNKLITVKQGEQHRALFRHAAQPLAEQQINGQYDTTLLAADKSGSILNAKAGENAQDHSYSAYGHNPTLPSMLTVAGFNSEFFDPRSACYLLGLGYRTYNPVLMRFRSADSWSPFGQGGINAYAYCSGDPINYTDPSGHILALIKPAPPLINTKPRPPKFLTSFRNQIRRRFTVEHYETSTRTVIGHPGDGNGANSQAITTTRRTLRTTELFEVVADPHRGQATVHVTRTNLDSFLEVSNDLRAAQAVNALGNTAKAVSPAYLQNLENRRLGLTLYGEALAQRAANPLDLTAYEAGTFRVSPGSASAIRRASQ
jgi:RHS repeat-associated protein